MKPPASMYCEHADFSVSPHGFYSVFGLLFTCGRCKKRWFCKHGTSQLRELDAENRYTDTGESVYKQTVEHEHRMAVLRISTCLLDCILEAEFGVRSSECRACWINRLGMDAVSDAMGFPLEARIKDVSTAYAFDKEEVAMRILSPDFVSVPEGCTCPTVEAVYSKDGFVFWNGAVRQDYVKHCDRPGYIPRKLKCQQQ